MTPSSIKFETTAILAVIVQLETVPLPLDLVIIS